MEEAIKRLGHCCQRVQIVRSKKREDDVPDVFWKRGEEGTEEEGVVLEEFGSPVLHCCCRLVGLWSLGSVDVFGLLSFHFSGSVQCE